MTSSPGAHSVTALPTAASTPAASTPSAVGGLLPTSQPPVRANSSQLPTPAALTSISTSSSARGRGRGTSIMQTSPPIRRIPATSIGGRFLLVIRGASTGRPSALAAASSRQPFEQVVADAQRIRDRRERGIHCGGGRKEARVDDVEVVEVVRLAVHVERRPPGIDAEAHG